MKANDTKPEREKKESAYKISVAIGTSIETRKDEIADTIETRDETRKDKSAEFQRAHFAVRRFRISAKGLGEKFDARGCKTCRRHDRFSVLSF